MGERSAL